MKYLDNEKEIPQSVREMVIALQIVRVAINFKEQLSEQSVQNAIELLEKNNLETQSFLRAIKRIKIKYLE
jgi:hypothetical protein